MKNKNTIELVGHYGSDESHALSAWTSTSRELTDGKSQRIGKLLHMLAIDGHHTPFEKSSLHFLVTTDIATHIQLLKHRIGVSINAESARYKELKEDKYFLPEDWKGIRISDNGEALNTPSDDWHQRLAEYTEEGNRLYHKCIKDLEPVLGRKRAKESARFFKTYNSQITADVMFNFRSFVHFLNLRNKPDAQLEIQELSGTMLELVKSIDGNPFKLTLEAFELK
jgi:flavin-dependent thymidylate synthase